MEKYEIVDNVLNEPEVSDLSTENLMQNFTHELLQDLETNLIAYLSVYQLENGEANPVIQNVSIELCNVLRTIKKMPKLRVLYDDLLHKNTNFPISCLEDENRKDNNSEDYSSHIKILNDYSPEGIFKVDLLLCRIAKGHGLIFAYTIWTATVQYFEMETGYES